MLKALVLAALVVVVALPVSAGLREGLAAYKDGDYRAALHEFEPLAERGDAAAQYHLGVMHAKGLGVRKNNYKAASWYNKAAKNGHAEAQYNLGQMYATDRGVPRNLGRAAHWFKKAAEQGLPKAQVALSTMYAKGWGVQKNHVLSYMWSSIAAKHGQKHAAKSLESIKKHMTSGQIAKAQEMAAKWRPTKAGPAK